MTIGDILRGMTPPALTAFYRKVCGNFNSPWKGVYKQYRDVPTSGTFFDSAFIVSMAEHTRSLKEALAGGPQSGTDCEGDKLLLPLLAGAVAAGRPVKIIDFGGGLGESYLWLKAAMTESVEYHVVELERTCAEGRRIFEDVPGLVEKS